MVKKMKVLFVLFAILSCIGCLDEGADGFEKARKYEVEATVLSVNENILAGEMVGRFLGSASGSFSSDHNKIGVSFKIKGILFLMDLNLRHAELAYLKDANKIRLTVRASTYCGSAYNCPLIVKFNGRIVGSEKITTERAKKLIYD